MEAKRRRHQINANQSDYHPFGQRRKSAPWVFSQVAFAIRRLMRGTRKSGGKTLSGLKRGCPDFAPTVFAFGEGPRYRFNMFQEHFSG